MTLDEILALPPDRFDTKVTWDQLDGLISGLPNSEAQINEWNRVLRHAESIAIPTGHPHFRLGILHLFVDTDETVGLAHLQLAYESDQKYAPLRAHRMAAYRMLSLAKDFLADLGSKKSWQRRQLEPKYRRVLISMLLALYDLTARRDILDRRYRGLTPLKLDDRSGKTKRRVTEERTEGSDQEKTAGTHRNAGRTNSAECTYGVISKTTPCPPAPAADVVP
jgi:hypothetical protein